MVKVLIIMADYGHDPTEVAIPYQAFKDAGFDVNFATETGSTPRCDARMLEGLSQKFLGAAASTIKLYGTMVKSAEMQNPLSWTSVGFTLDDFDIVHIPGGHDKEVRQLMDSTTAQKLLADYFPQTKKPGKKIVSAICHGPLVLCNTKGQDGNSVLYHCTTTALPGCFESLAYHGTRLFLGDYYKTYGAGTENVEDSMRKVVKDPSQFKSSWMPNRPFVVEDTEYNYISARFPPDAAKLAEMTVNLAHLIHVQGFKGQDPTTA
ncbi:ThiJ/PfpI family protein [Colletotrichum scovillei]|nr:ThiJ/PfpI family protein [Colletotrichum scovillei]KAF4775300.1 ThiJ/PfpI family protein [Colletotrichum scovillei]